MSILNSTEHTVKSGGLDKVAFIVLQVTLFLTPIFFIPSLAVPLQTGRAAFILYGIIIAFIIWAIARLKDGIFEAPKSLFYASAGVLALAYTAAALFSLALLIFLKARLLKNIKSLSKKD